MQLIKNNKNKEKQVDEFLGLNKEGSANPEKPWQAVFPCDKDEERAIREGFGKSTSKKISDYLKKIVLDYHNYESK